MTAAARVLAAVALVLAGAGTAAAEHEVFYRYTVLGYVKDAGGRPAAGQTVELIRDKTGFSYLAETDEQGLFVIIARLGDESAGERLTLHASGLTLPLLARFDVANHVDERGTRVDLEGRRFVERAAWFRSTLVNLVGEKR
ncbi:MAG TPA: carboxypeptidase-like regulatory domain-containing protein [Methylomirabilota bacterium]|jgi:hypothetical protein|nr:carboxypeptidase-like regulatory domain-containing protein [Methylomirabilota bacterium]